MSACDKCTIKDQKTVVTCSLCMDGMLDVYTLGDLKKVNPDLFKKLYKEKLAMKLSEIKQQLTDISNNMYENDYQEETVELERSIQALRRVIIQINRDSEK